MSAIGIWTKSEVSGELKRDHARKMDWPYWADVARIPRKAGRKRIAFVGESAARGYFFDPEYTPAAALEELTGYEVLDLARTDLRLSAFEELLSKLPALEPDAIVLYAGNNWQLSMSEEAKAKLAETLARGGALADWRDALELAGWSELCKKLLAAMRPLNAPVVWVLPPINLSGWSWSHLRQEAPLLAPGDNERWHTLYRRARLHFDRSELEDCVRLCSELVALDRRTSAVSLELFGRALLAKGEPERARALLHEASDQVYLDEARRCPRARSSTIQAIRQTAKALGHRTIDLEEIFWSGRGSDAEYFLDYCHLSAQGHQVLTAAAAAELGNLLVGGNSTWRDLAARAPRPSAECELRARELAALHNQNWSQPAQARAPLAEKILSSREPEALSPHIRGLSSQSRQFERYFMALTLNSLALENGVTKRPVRNAACARIREGDFNLLDGAHSPSPGHRGYFQNQNHRAFWKIGEAESVFEFIGAPRPGSSLAITFKCAHGPVAVELNGARIAALAPATGWARSTIPLPHDMFTAELNQLTLRWPVPKDSLESLRGRLIEQARRGAETDLFPLYGYLDELTIRSGSC